jgi:CheY-like chemotaxis protein
VLKRHGFDASWVTDAEQASERLLREPFDVLLADCRLPGRSGVDLARMARQAQPEMGIAVMTSYAEADAESTARSNGADDFFEKPLHSSNLVTRIGALVTRSRASRTVIEESPPVRGAAKAGPVVPVLGATPRRGEASGPDFVAESGPERHSEARDSTSAQPQGNRSGEYRFEGTGGPRQARSSAPWNVESEGSGCGERHRADLGGGSGQRGPDPSAGVTEVTAETRGEAVPAEARRVHQPVLLWANTAPSVPITSTIGPVAAPRTGPDWSVSY